MEKKLAVLALFALLCATAGVSSDRHHQRLGAVSFAEVADERLTVEPQAKDEAAAPPTNGTGAEAKADEIAKKVITMLQSLPGSHLSVAMRTVLALLILFFVVQTVIKIVQTTQEVRTAHMGETAEDGGDLGYHQESDATEPVNLLNGGFFSLQSLQGMKSSMDSVPMVCVLCVFTRLRAVVELHTEPQPYAKGFFIVSAVAIYLNACMALLLPLCGVGKGLHYKVGKAIDWLATVLLYMSVIAIVISIATLERCHSPETKDQAYACALGNKDLSGHVNGLAQAKAGL